jgi:hypothetical protein
MNPGSTAPAPAAATDRLLGRIRWVTGFLMAGLVVSGLTAMPLVTEVNYLCEWTGVGEEGGRDSLGAMAQWLLLVREGLAATQREYPFMFYGMDWLAFGHFVIALAFVGAWRDPVRNVWLFQFGLAACALVLPFALILGEVRGIPVWWRLLDACFGLAGAVPLALGWYWTRRLELLSALR